MRRLLIIAAMATLAACATATPYQPRGAGAYGFSERPIEQDRVAISFRGNSLTERDTVETYLLYRAAELTLERGYDYFIATQRDVDVKSTLTPTLAYRTYGFAPFYSYYSPRWGWRPYHDPFFADPVQYEQVTRFEASAEIVMRRGQRPSDQATAFDARQVVANLGPQIRRPQTGG